MSDSPDAGGTDLDDAELTAEERDELLQQLERKRSLRGPAAVALSLFAVLFSLFQVWVAAKGYVFGVDLPVVGRIQLAALQQLQVNAVHVVFALVLAFVLYPPSTGDGFLARAFGRLFDGIEARSGSDSAVASATERARAAGRWAAVDEELDRVTPLDLLLIVAAVSTAVYYLMEFDEILTMRALGLGAGRPVGEVYAFLAPVQAALSPVLPFVEASWAYLLGVVAILLVLEATRRALSFYLMCIVGSFVVYAKYAHLIPGDAPLVAVLATPEFSWTNIVRNLWYTDQGILGIPVLVSVQFIYIFILFGAFLEMSGAGEWFIDLAYSLTGDREGGPAKASILASGFMGTISGSSIANTVTTGAFTIPLMKKSGYRAEFAGGVEASASSGGQILPPVMGAAAFLIVEYTGTPYPDVILAATIPAVVFFFGIWVMVHLEASRADIGTVTDVDVVDLRSHLSRGWFYLVPIVLLLYFLLVVRLSVARSAWFTILAIMALVSFVAAYTRETRAPLLGAIAVLAAVRAGVAVASGNAPLPAVQGGLGWIVIGGSLAVLLARPDVEAPWLDYNDRVDELARSVGGPALTAPGKFLTFVYESLDGGARTATQVVVAVAAAGIIPGVVATTGLGPNLASLIRSLAGGSLVLLLVITAVACIILGMGMPTTVTYIILVSLLGPVIEQAGNIPVLGAHLFILYFGVIADITPPVAVAAYAASGVAKSDPFRTGVEAFSLSLNKAIVPFAFVMTPGILLLRGTDGSGAAVLGPSDVADVGYFLPEVAAPILGIFVGVVALAVTVIGYLYSEANALERVGFAVAAVLLMAPGLVLTPLGSATVTFDLGVRGLGAVLFGLFALTNRKHGATPGETTSA